MDELGSVHPPRFTKHRTGRSTSLTLETATCIALSVRSNATDPTLWPPGRQTGATTLQRVREIESGCVARVGEFDSEELSPALQDEYDTLCTLLDSLQGNEGTVTWEGYKVSRRENRD